MDLLSRCPRFESIYDRRPERVRNRLGVEVVPVLGEDEDGVGGQRTKIDLIESVKEIRKVLIK